MQRDEERSIFQLVLMPYNAYTPEEIPVRADKKVFPNERVELASSEPRSPAATEKAGYQFLNASLYRSSALARPKRRDFKSLD